MAGWISRRSSTATCNPRTSLEARQCAQRTEPVTAHKKVLRGISGASVLAPDWQFCVCVGVIGAQSDYRCSTDVPCFALSGESLLRAKVTKTLRPIIRPRLRRGPLTPSPFQRHAAKGHPWPIAALAASMPLNLFHDDCVRPPGRALHACLNRRQFMELFVLEHGVSHRLTWVLYRVSPKTYPVVRARGCPFRRVSGIVA